MTRLRGARGLRKLADETSRDFPLSKSTLQRYEAGEQLPPLRNASALDSLYGANGWIALSLAQLWKPMWNPWKADWPEVRHSYRWPADYAGPVWMHLRSVKDSIDLQNDVEIRWGPWRRTLTVLLVEEGVTVWTGKAADRDGIARTLDLTLTLPAFVLFGAGSESLDAASIDIRDDWVLRAGNTEDVGKAQGPGDPAGGDDPRRVR